MPATRIFLDTPILREAFVRKTNGVNWRQEYNLPSGVQLVTGHKCLAEVHGILKTSILDTELAVYGCVSSKRFRDMILKGDDFLNIFWHHQILEKTQSELPQPIRANEQGKRLQLLIKWRTCYEAVRADFDQFLRQEAIECVHYGVLFSHHEWQAKFDDLATETLIPSEDLEIVLAAWYARADVFLTRDKRLVQFSFSLPLEPGIPVFSTPEDLEHKLAEKQQGVISFAA